jgi:hypothetical protein
MKRISTGSSASGGHGLKPTFAVEHGEKHMAAAVANLERARLVGDREMAINRIFDAPRDRVFRSVDRSGSNRPVVGPRGFSTTTYSMEAQTGGVWKYNGWLTGYIVSFAERTSYSAKPCRK